MSNSVGNYFKTIAKAVLGRPVNSLEGDGSLGIKCVDTRLLSIYVNQNIWLKRYYDGLNIANQGERDSLVKQARYISLQQLAEHVVSKGIDGDFVECGCFRGHSTHILSSIVAENNLQSMLHVFDSFEGGLSDKGELDKSEFSEQTAADIKEEKLHFSSSESDVARVLADFDFVKLYKGWIPERFPEVESRSFAFVHLDVDLYQPIKDSLEFFYPRLVPGGAIVIDDYGWSNFPGAKKATDEFLKENSASFFYQVPTSGAFIVK